jgi:predicted transposase YbfD/YdcC
LSDKKSDGMKNNIYTHFKSLKDSRKDRKKLHSLHDIISLVVIGIICSADSWDAIEEFGKAKIEFLSTFLTLENGIPSHDTISRVFASIDSVKFEKCFISWVNSLKDKDIKREVIAIDGKTICGSKDSFHNTKATHLVSAWACNNKLVLGQTKVDGKSNEITAIPVLLDLLDIQGSIITIDAMGTQTEIAKLIIEKKADYILALKGNQGTLEQDVESIFRVQKPDSQDLDIEKNRGRIESRKCEVIQDLHFLEGKEKWTGIKSIIKITSIREIKEKKTTEIRLYMSSLDSSAMDLNQYIRQHWGVENSLHWTLDMTFNEDRQRKRDKNAAQNFAQAQKIALNLLKNEGSTKMSIRTKRLKAAWDNNFLLKILGF